MSLPIDKIIIFQKAIIFDKKRFLALKRKKTDLRRPGAWDLPGGALIKGEDIGGAIKREVFEETSLKIFNLQPIYVKTIKNLNPIGIDNLYICWQVGKWQGKIKLSDEHVDFSWATQKEFSRLKTWDEQGFLQKSVLRAIL